MNLPDLKANHRMWPDAAHQDTPGLHIKATIGWWYVLSDASGRITATQDTAELLELLHYEALHGRGSVRLLVTGQGIPEPQQMPSLNKVDLSELELDI